MIPKPVVIGAPEWRQQSPRAPVDQSLLPSTPRKVTSKVRFVAYNSTPCHPHRHAALCRALVLTWSRVSRHAVSAPGSERWRQQQLQHMTFLLASKEPTLIPCSGHETTAPPAPAGQPSRPRSGGHWAAGRVLRDVWDGAGGAMTTAASASHTVAVDDANLKAARRPPRPRSSNARVMHQNAYMGNAGTTWYDVVEFPPSLSSEQRHRLYNTGMCEPGLRMANHMGAGSLPDEPPRLGRSVGASPRQRRISSARTSRPAGVLVGASSPSEHPFIQPPLPIGIPQIQPEFTPKSGTRERHDEQQSLQPPSSHTPPRPASARLPSQAFNVSQRRPQSSSGSPKLFLRPVGAHAVEHTQIGPALTVSSW